MSDQPATDSTPVDNTTPLGVPQFMPLTTRLILWQIAKEIAHAANELA